MRRAKWIEIFDQRPQHLQCWAPRSNATCTGHTRMLTWQIGDVRITQIVELTTASIGPYLLPQATPDLLGAIEWLAPFIDAQHRIVLSIHALVLETRIGVSSSTPASATTRSARYPRWNRMQGRFLAGFRRRRIRARSRRHGVVHAHARRSRRLEHAARRRSLGADVRKRAVSVRGKGVAALEPRTAGIRSCHRRLGAADLRSRLSRPGE